MQIAPYWRDCETEGLSSVSEPRSYCSLSTKNCGEWEVHFSSKWAQKHRPCRYFSSVLHCFSRLTPFPVPTPPYLPWWRNRTSQCKAAKFIMLWCNSYFVVVLIILLMFFGLVCLRIFWLQYMSDLRLAVFFVLLPYVPQKLTCRRGMICPWCF